VGRLQRSYTVGTGSKSQELTPGQLLERLGFRAEQLSTPVKDLSGGQQRRLQLLLVLLDQPNVLILDEPSTPIGHSVRTPSSYRCQSRLLRRHRRASPHSSREFQKGAR